MANSLDKIEAGSMVDHYRVEECVSRDKMYSIYRAVDTSHDRLVALKIPTSLVDNDSALYDRLRREIEIGQRLNHPSILKVYPGEHASSMYMVMEWVEGKTLRVLLSEGRIPQERAIALMRSLLEALEYIHVNGVFHRDLSPESVMVGDDDQIKIIDFGLAGSVAARRLTYTNMSGELSAPYISPEQATGKRGDARSDIYSAAVLFYEMLTGKLPFTGANSMAVMNARLAGPPIPPTVADPTVTPQLQEVLYRALEKDPHKRYFSAREFLNDLENLDQVGVSVREEEKQWRSSSSPLKRRVLMFLLLILVPVLIFSLVFLLK